ncbi:MAG: hypothetical protein M3O50_10445 [Myxococcota bacterium]|nr:hypothetical protein [Myxococcota bacterium]
MITRKFWRNVSWPILFAGVGAPFVANCGGGMPGVPSMPTSGVMPAVPSAGSCPDMGKADAIDAFDFEKEFKLRTEVAAKIKAGAGAAAEMTALSEKIDGDLKVACGTLARDLGAAGEFKDGQDACKGAIKAIGDVKARMGARAEIKVDVTEPHCGVDLNAYADCAGHCDATVKGGKAEVKCEPGKLQGQCTGKCQGQCEVSGGAQCTGECDGTCDADVKGSCGGKCAGKCDGKVLDAKANGKCAGVCEGKCDATVKGECHGKCGGDCKINGQAECKGTCTGSCSAEMQSPKCTGAVQPPQVSAECKAKCDAHMEAKAQCTAPHVVVRIAGSADDKAEETFRKAIENDLGSVLKVSAGVGKNASRIASNVKVVVQAAEAGVQGAGDAVNVARLTACVAAPFRGALEAAASVQANVSVSVNVQASATASGSAKSG